MSRLSYVLIFSVFVIGFGMAAPAIPTNEGYSHDIPMQFPASIPKCSDNEIFKPCGSACAPNCANPNPGPICTRNCVVGCFCKDGLLRNAQGVCVPAGECQGPLSFMLLQQEQQECNGQNEEFRKCKGCDGTCKNPNPLCPRICKPGCACKPGHLRSDEGKCVETRECAAQAQPVQSIFKSDSLETVKQCNFNELFNACGTACPATCTNPHPSPVCTRNCVIGCFCVQGTLRDEKSGLCFAPSMCPP